MKELKRIHCKIELIKIDEDFVEKSMQKIKKALANIKEPKIIDKDFVSNYITKIQVFQNGSMDITLRTGEILNIDLSRFKDIEDKNEFRKDAERCCLMYLSPGSYPEPHSPVPLPPRYDPDACAGSNG